MALMDCPECGKKISDKAFSCPGCGCPVEKNKMKIEVEIQEGKRRGGCLTAFLVLDIVASIVSVIFSPFLVGASRTQFPDLPGWLATASIFLTVLSLISCLGIWNWKKWGVQLFIFMQALYFLLSACFLPIQYAMFGLIWPVIFLFLVIPIWKYMDEEEPVRSVSPGKSENPSPGKKIVGTPCKKCGGVVERGADFCGDCGHRQKG